MKGKKACIMFVCMQLPSNYRIHKIQTRFTLMWRFATAQQKFLDDSNPSSANTNFLSLYFWLNKHVCVPSKIYTFHSVQKITLAHEALSVTIDKKVHAINPATKGMQTNYKQQVIFFTGRVFSQKKSKHLYFGKLVAKSFLADWAKNLPKNKPEQSQ